MNVYVVTVRESPEVNAPISAHSTLELAQEEADNHAARTYGITARLCTQGSPDDCQTLSFGDKSGFVVNYDILRFVVDAEAKS